MLFPNYFQEVSQRFHTDVKIWTFSEKMGEGDEAAELSIFKRQTLCPSLIDGYMMCCAELGKQIY